MRSELRLHRLLLAMLATLLIAFVAVLFYLGTNVANEHFEATVSLVVMITVGTAFVYMGTAEGIVAFQFGLRHNRELWSYLILGLVSVVSGLYLAMSETASLQTVAVVVSPHAFLFGIAELRIAQHMQHHPKQRTLLLVGGLCELLLGAVLMSGPRFSVNHVATLLGCAAVLTAFQILAFLFYRRPNLSLHTRRS
ncbi:DUF308 domain-containing protein [Edaphobacter aggregans]|uniref:DUF308 domain-containing protein n=1 Tax=Edaphobacter aggregans TaxID=570835 RepID=UPI00054F5B14|nr:DUF308 domain-containing protein [Edaphobacter aggregans]